MFRPILSLLVLTLIQFSYSIAQESADPLQDLRVDVVYLASDYLQGRATGSEGELLAAQYVAKRFEECGLKPKGFANRWFQPFNYTFRPNPHAEEGIEGVGRNVVGYLDNGAATTVIIGAHYDHIGLGDFSSLDASAKGEVHNGADDNASGVAALFYLAKYLKQSWAKNNNYLFIAFSGEEMGLVGSKYFVNHPTIDLSTVNYMFNMDMVGRLNEEKSLVINGVGTSPVWKTILPQIQVAGIKTITSESGIGASDHSVFYLKDLPVLHFFTGAHNDYHRPSDDANKLNFQGIEEVSRYMIAIIEKLDKSGKIEFSKSKMEQQERTAAAFKVTLGVLPDYVFNGKGMKIDGVLEGRTAEKAGIKNGDVVIQIGEMEVKDIYSYMEGLSKFSKGDKTIVIVKRGEETIEKEVEF